MAPSSTYTEIGTQLTETHGITTGQMFGKPCLKIKNKAFSAFFQEEMVFKLGREHLPALIEQLPGSILWDPSGKKRPMKDWLQVPGDHQDQWASLAERALGFVEAQL